MRPTRRPLRTGGLPAVLPVEQLKERLALLRRTAEAAGRDPSPSMLHPNSA